MYEDLKKYVNEMEGRDVQVHYKGVNVVAIPDTSGHGVNLTFPGPSGKVTKAFESFFELRTPNGPMTIPYDNVGALFFPSEIASASGMPGPGLGGRIQ